LFKARNITLKAKPLGVILATINPRVNLKPSELCDPQFQNPI